MSSFSPTGKLSESIFKERYAAHEGESWEAACLRVAKHVASAELETDLGGHTVRNIWTWRFESEIAEGRFMPGGRIWYGSGRPQGQLLNCFVCSSEDSIEGWAKTVGDVMIITAKGGGVGINLSNVRGRGALIKGTNGYSTGAVSLAEMINMNGDVISGGGGRRLALMLDLDITHPDMPEFLDAKLEQGKLENANISLVLNMDPREFVRKVRNGEEIALEFEGKPTGQTVNARTLMERIVRNSWTNGEPGLLNGWLANQQNNIFYHKPLVSTNPCLTGDTRIMTIDGPRTFASLAEAGRDVLVYAWHPDSKKPVVRWMRHPRLTRRNADIIEVEFDSGLKLRGTPDHHVYSFRGKKTKLRDLKVGSSVRAWSMSEHRDGHLRVHGWNSERNLSEHQWVARMIWENAYGAIPDGAIIHHKNEDKTDNRLENLEIIASNSEHNRLHYSARFEAGFDGTAKNHKVVAIRSAGTEDVYNGTVDDAHTYIVVDPEPVSGIASGIVSANCGEIWLEEYGCCCLGSIVLPRFVKDGVFDWQAFRTSVQIGVRFLDDVLTVNKYPLEVIKENCEDVRRIGLGVMGVHNMLLELGMKYSSPEAIEFLDKLFFEMKVAAYRMSIDLAVEKGSFSKFDPAMADSGYCSTLPDAIRNAIRKKGIRNCALLTIAPTGTTALVQGVSSGIEPLYAPVHIRTWWEEQRDGSKKFKRELVVDPMFEKYPELCEGAMDLAPAAHFEVQRVAQKHIDNAVSKTINLPESITEEELMEVWLRYLPYCKGTTLFRENSRVAYDDQGNPYTPLTPVKAEDVHESMLKWGYTIEENQELQNSMDCPDGVCSIDQYRALQEAVA